MGKNGYMARMRKMLCGLVVLTAFQAWVPAIAQNADAVVTEDNNEVRVGNGMAFTWTRHRSVTLHNERAAHHAVFSIYMSDDMVMDKFQLSFSDTSGKVLRTFKQKELTRSELSEGLAADGYMLLLDATPPTYPVVVSYDLKVSFKRNNISIPMFAPLDSYNTEVEKASYDISFPTDFPLRYKMVNTSAAPTETTADGRCQWHFQMSNLKAVSNTEYGLPLSEMMPKIYFTSERFDYYKTSGSLASWNDLGKWTYSLFEGRDGLPEEAKVKVRSLTQDCANDREKVAAIYQFLASTTRYVSIQLGIGGFQPMSAAEVWKRGYGDCKALSNYMMALLAEVGIASHCVSISTKEKRLLADFPNFQQLNHMILEVPLSGDTLWVECTNPKLPLGYVHDDISGHEALEISSSGGRVLTLPEYPDSCNLNLTEASVELDADGAATISITERYQYHRYARMFPLLSYDDSQLRKVMFALYLLPQAEISEVSVSDDSKPYAMPELAYRLKARSGKYASTTAARLFVPTNLLHKNFSPAPDSHRANELFIGHGSRTCERIVIHLPEGYEIEKTPQPVTLSLPFAEFTSVATLTDGQLVITNDYLLRHGTFTDAATAFNEFEKKLSEVYSRKLVLKKSM